MARTAKRKLKHRNPNARKRFSKKGGFPPTSAPATITYDKTKLYYHKYFLDKKRENSLGHGAYGATYIYKDSLGIIKSSKKYAVKIMQSGTTTHTDRDIQKLYDKEVNILNQLLQAKDPGGIIKYYGSSHDKPLNQYYIITEYDENFTLNLNKFSNTVSDLSFATLYKNLCKGLKNIHSAGVIHRDIKPENILYNPKTFDIKYIDFGFAVIKDKQTVNNTTIVNLLDGTQPYIDPEFITTNVNSTHKYSSGIRNIDNGFLFKSDWWALGITIYEIYHRMKTYTILKEDPGDLPHFAFIREIETTHREKITSVIDTKPSKIPIDGFVYLQQIMFYELIYTFEQKLLDRFTYYSVKIEQFPVIDVIRGDFTASITQVFTNLNTHITEYNKNPSVNINIDEVNIELNRFTTLAETIITDVIYNKISGRYAQNMSNIDALNSLLIEQTLPKISQLLVSNAIFTTNCTQSPTLLCCLSSPP